MTQSQLYELKSYDPIRAEEYPVRHLNLLPNELRNSQMWLISADNDGRPGGKRPYILTDSGKLQPYTKTAGHQPMTYQVVNDFAMKYGYDIGIVMTSNDHYVVIDLDAKGLEGDGYTKRMELFAKIIHSADSYAELSKSGKGYHIIVKSDILVARNSQQHGIEVYSYRERFLLCTGNKVSVTADGTVINEFETAKMNTSLIPYREDIVNYIIDTIKPDYAEEGIVLTESEPTKSNDSVIDEILQSHFSEQFMEIMTFSPTTDYTHTKYPSGSEACLNAIAILCRFTQSNEQVRTIFREFDIAKRDKYTKNNYHIDRCLTIARGEQDLTLINDFVEKACAAYAATQSAIIERRMTAEKEQLAHVNDFEEDSVDLSEVYAQYETDIDNFADIPHPHGLIGEISRFIEAAAPHKLRVASVGGALGIMSGIVGRQFRYNGSSLNHAFVIVANSTMGKESSVKGMSSVSKALASCEGDNFFCFEKVSSASALKTIMRESKYGSVVATFPEFAVLLEQIKNGNDNAMAGLKGELLDVLTKNSEDSFYGGSKHAKKEDHREGMEAPSFSFIGDCTPNFYEGITEEMNSSGFMSRLIVLTHEGTTKDYVDRQAHLVKLSKFVVDDLKLLVQQVTSKYNANTFIPIVESPEVAIASVELEGYLKLKYNTAADDSHRQIYGRTYLKVMTIASLFAACENIGSPVITMQDFEWARTLIMRDVYITTRKLKNGEIGVSEETCKRRVASLITKLLTRPKDRDKLAKVYNHVLDLGIVPRSLLSQRLQGNSFKIGQLSNTKTLEAVIDNMIKNGDIKVVSDEKKHIVTQFTGRSIRGICYEECNELFNEPLRKVEEWLTEVGKAEMSKFL
jgi:hypothetical protein